MPACGNVTGATERHPIPETRSLEGMKHRDALVFLAAIFAFVLGLGNLPAPAMTVAAVLLAVLWVWAIVDAAKTAEGSWLAARRSKTVAIVVLVLLGPAMAATYALSIRPDLARSAPA